MTAEELRQQGLKKIKRQVEPMVVEGCKNPGVSVTELRSGSRRGVTAQVRAEIARNWLRITAYIGRGGATGWHFDLWSVEVVEPECVNLVNYVPE